MSAAQLIFEQTEVKSTPGLNVVVPFALDGIALSEVEVVIPDGVAIDVNAEESTFSFGSSQIGSYAVQFSHEGETLATVNLTVAEEVETQIDAAIEEAPETTTEAPAGAAAEEPAKDAPETDEVAEDTEEQPAVAEVPVEKHPEEDLMARLLSYTTAMAPGTPIDATVGARQQVRLFQAIQSVISKPVSDFERYWITLLTYVKENREGVFHEKYIGRFMEHFPASKEERLLFQRLINLLLTSVDVERRAMVSKQIDFGLIKDLIKNDANYMKLINFYNPRSE